MAASQTLHLWHQMTCSITDECMLVRNESLHSFTTKDATLKNSSFARCDFIVCNMAYAEGLVACDTTLFSHTFYL